MSRSVARSELTLEIGGGHNPAPAADVVVDKFLFDNSQRAGSLRCDRPLVIGDGESLPFRDKAFARTVGRQVMEHMDDVQRFFQELMRVSSGGYLASPSYLRELVFWWPYHHWLFTREKDVLVCAPKSGQRPLAGQLFHYLARQEHHGERFAERPCLDRVIEPGAQRFAVDCARDKGTELPDAHLGVEVCGKALQRHARDLAWVNLTILVSYLRFQPFLAQIEGTQIDQPVGFAGGSRLR